MAWWNFFRFIGPSFQDGARSRRAAAERLRDDEMILVLLFLLSGGSGLVRRRTHRDDQVLSTRALRLRRCRLDWQTRAPVSTSGVTVTSILDREGDLILQHLFLGDLVSFWRALPEVVGHAIRGI
jgi:hypothetical protein